MTTNPREAVKAGPKACCLQASNLTDAPSGRPDVVIKVCAACGCRHFEATIDPMRLGVELKGL